MEAAPPREALRAARGGSLIVSTSEPQVPQLRQGFSNAGSSRAQVWQSQTLRRFAIGATPDQSAAPTGSAVAGEEAGGADAISVINTCLGMAVDWRRRKPLLGNVVGGLSGPAIKPIALRCVHQVRRAVETPIIGVGGILTIDDVMEFIVTGASAVQVGTASFLDPAAPWNILRELREWLDAEGVESLDEIRGAARNRRRRIDPIDRPGCEPHQAIEQQRIMRAGEHHDVGAPGRILRIADGKIVETWFDLDMLGLMGQLGVGG